MTAKERMECVLRGEVPDRVPFAVFDELMPRSWAERMFRERGMGLIRHMDTVFPRTTMPVTTKRERDCKRVQFHTSQGVLEEVHQYKTGLSNTGWVCTRHMYREEDDFPALLEYIDSLTFETDETGYDAQVFLMGEEGITHTWTDEPPYMSAQNYMGLEDWSYAQVDCPEEFAQLMEALERSQARRMQHHLDGPQTLFNLGNLAGNFSPEKFEQYMAPYIARYAALFHERGKKVTLHADASNLSAFRESVPLCHVDLIEAFTPPPVGDLSLADARKAWGEDLIIRVNLPEIVLYEGYQAGYDFTAELLQSDPSPRKMIGFTEMGFLGADVTQATGLIRGIEGVLDAIDRYGVYQ